MSTMESTTRRSSRPEPDQDVDERRAWARRYIRAASTAPAYGTPEWLRLPDGPAKVAAVVRAAECWALEGDLYEENLRAQLEAEALAAKRSADAEWVARGEAHAEAFDSRLPGFRRCPQIEADVEREWVEWAGGVDA